MKRGLKCPVRYSLRGAFSGENFGESNFSTWRLEVHIYIVKLLQFGYENTANFR